MTDIRPTLKSLGISVADLAKYLKCVSVSHVNDKARGEQLFGVPAVLSIERLTRGVVNRYILRPDIYQRDEYAPTNQPSDKVKQ